MALNLIVLFICLMPCAILAEYITFQTIHGYLCIKEHYIIDYDHINSGPECMFLCQENNQCRAAHLDTTTEVFRCRLFVFDKCEKDVVDCSCSIKGTIFVKNTPGLEPGKMCPEGYGHNRCGTKYKLHSNPLMSWSSGLDMCNAEKGLVFMADITNQSELNHISSFLERANLKTTIDIVDGKTIKQSSREVYVGGYQRPYSREPSGDWKWVTCKKSLPGSGSLWHNGEPDDTVGKESAVSLTSRAAGQWKLQDTPEDDLKNVLCECLSPFD